MTYDTLKNVHISIVPVRLLYVIGMVVLCTAYYTPSVEPSQPGHSLDKWILILYWIFPI